MPIDNIAAFRDTMNASYIPGAVSNIGSNSNNNQTFSNEFEKSVKISNSNRAEQTDRSSNKNEGKETATDSARKTDDNNSSRSSDTDARENTGTKVNRQPDDPHRETVKRPQNDTETSAGEKGENNTDKNQLETQKAVQSENQKNSANQKTVSDKVSLNETVNRAANKLGSIKEILRDNQVKTEAIVEGKEEIKEKFSDSQKIKNSTNVEKVMLKSLEASNQDAKTTKSTSSNTDTQTHNDKVNDIKSGEEVTIEKKDVSDVDIEKKVDKSTVKNETKAQTTNLRSDNGTVQFADNSKETRQLNEIKMKEVFTRNNTAEQYEVLKDKIVNSVQDSIKLLVSEGDSRATIKLHPPELGKIQVELIVKDNQVSAKINTDNVAVKEVILTNLNQLRSNIENAGIQVDKFDVEVGDFRNQSSGDLSGGSSGGGERRENSGNQELQDNDWLPDKVIKQQALNYFLGRSINFLV